LIEQGLTSPPTQYRLYGRRFFTGHKTQPTVSKYWRHTEITFINRNLRMISELSWPTAKPQFTTITQETTHHKETTKPGYQRQPTWCLNKHRTVSDCKNSETPSANSRIDGWLGFTAF